MNEDRYPVSHEFEVKSYEVDFAGIVSNQVYLRWSEDLRTKLLDQFVSILDLFKTGKVPVLAHTGVDYKYPARLKDTVTGKMWVEELNGPKWSLRGEFWIGERMCAKVFHSGVWVDAKTFRPTRAPDVMPHVSL